MVFVAFLLNGFEARREMESKWSFRMDSMHCNQMDSKEFLTSWIRPWDSLDGFEVRWLGWSRTKACSMESKRGLVHGFEVMHGFEVRLREDGFEGRNAGFEHWLIRSTFSWWVRRKTMGWFRTRWSRTWWVRMWRDCAMDSNTVPARMDSKHG